jgi:hypothetical protein
MSTLTLTLRHLVAKVLIYNQMFIFSISVLIRHLWQLKTVVFLHWHLIRVVLFQILICKEETMQFKDNSKCLTVLELFVQEWKGLLKYLVYKYANVKPNGIEASALFQ